VSSCRSCGAAIVWTSTERGRLMPVDAEPVARGLRLEPAADGPPRALVTDIYASHFATCPNADTHRQTRETESTQ
jgi:hypothetical protein